MNRSECSRDISFRYGSGLALATVYCPGSCMSAVFDGPSETHTCDTSDKRQSWTIQPVAGSPAVQIKSDYTHQCVGLTDCRPGFPTFDDETRPLVESTALDCDDPDTEMIFINGFFMAWNCWKQGVADLYFDPSGELECEQGMFDDDGFGGGLLMFLDPCVLDSH